MNLTKVSFYLFRYHHQTNPLLQGLQLVSIILQFTFDEDFFHLIFC